MDMNSNLGGFAAALSDRDVWVMNVAPTRASARLKIIYDRGLIGSVHDWYAYWFPKNGSYRDFIWETHKFSNIIPQICSFLSEF